MDKHLSKKILLKAWQIRCFEKELLALSQQGKLTGTTHTSIGQELISASFSEFVKDSDFVFSNHRCHGHFLATHDLPYELFSEISGRQTGVCQGVGGSQHLHYKNFFANGILGGVAPISAGVSYSLGKKTDGKCVFTFLGDGAFGEGVVYETMNFVSKASSPHLFIVENNFISQSTAQTEVMAGTIEGRAKAFDLLFFKTDAWNLDHLYQTMQAAIESARKGKPAVLQIDCYRLSPHSRGDDDRPQTEIASYQKKDLLNIFIEQNATDQKLQKELDDISLQIKNSLSNALKAPLSQASWHLDRENQNIHHEFKVASQQSATIVEELRLSLNQFLESNEDALLIGEDIRDPYGGAFKVTKGLSTNHDRRVMNFSISEGLITGFCLGSALAGNKVIGEIMFGDFMSLTFDQILNHASKFSSFSALGKKCPFILRTPTGGGRGYGPTHSQSLEKYFSAIPGINVFLLHHRIDCTDFYQQLLTSITRPSLVFENKLLYSYRRKPLPGHWKHKIHDDGTVVITNAEKADTTLVAFGGMSMWAEEAMLAIEEEEITCDFILPLAIHCLPVKTIQDSVQRSGKLVIVEEGTRGQSLGAELLSQLCGKVSLIHRHVLSERGMIPAAKHLEEEFLVSKQKIIDACFEVFDA